MSLDTQPFAHRLSLPALLVRDAERCMAFERSRAPSFQVAARRWAGGQRERVERLLRLGQRRAAELWSAEDACARAGFCATVKTGSLSPGVCAPWHLPEVALEEGEPRWLAHPLIDTRIDPWRTPSDNIAATLRRHLLAGLATRSWTEVPVCSDRAPVPSAARKAVVLHLFYPEVWPELLEALQSLTQPWDLYVTVPSFANTPWLARITNDVPGARFFPGPNRGRDVLPWLRLMGGGHLDSYEWVCKLHTKRSPHIADGGRWRHELFTGLLGERGRPSTLQESLDTRPRAGIVGVATTLIPADHPRWAGSSSTAVRRLRSQLGLQENGARDAYLAGTMFWYRPAALARLKALADPELFESEFGQLDGTAAHAAERLVVSVARDAGFELHVA